MFLFQNWYDYSVFILFSYIRRFNLRTVYGILCMFSVGFMTTYTYLYTLHQILFPLSASLELGKRTRITLPPTP